jgi:CheY-like chemotaxis protein
MRGQVRALCVGRHEYLAEHLKSFFSDLGLETWAAVGLDDAVRVARQARPDVVICDYELLATRPLDAWEADALLSRTPVVAVSLSRRPEDVHLLDINGIAGALYLPQLDAQAARQMLAGIPRAHRSRAAVPSWSPDVPRPSTSAR